MFGRKKNIITLFIGALLVNSCALKKGDTPSGISGGPIDENPGTVVHAWCRGAINERPFNFVVRSTPPSTNLKTELTLEKTALLPEEKTLLDTTLSQSNSVRTYQTLNSTLNANAVIDLVNKPSPYKFAGNATYKSSPASTAQTFPVLCRVPSP